MSKYAASNLGASDSFRFKKKRIKVTTIPRIEAKKINVKNTVDPECIEGVKRCFI